MVKVLIYGLTDTKGGVENFLLNYISQCELSNIKIDLISNTENTVYEDEFKRLGCNIYKVCSKRRNPFQFRRDIKNIFENTESKYDIIWVNLCSLANIDYLKYAKKYGVNTRIVHCHSGNNMFGALKGYLHRINKSKIKNLATHYWACSNQAAQWFYPKNILSLDNFLVVNNAINLDKFIFDKKIRDNYRKTLNLDNKFVIGSIGRLHFKKNLDFLLEIMNELKDITLDDIHLLIIGGGDLEDKLKKQVNSLGLESVVSILGARDDIPQLLQAIDVFAMPSLVEGLPVSAVEAQASGVCCLLSDTITTEIKITDLVEFLPIMGNDSERKWIESLLNVKKGYIRRNMKDEIVKHNYEIRTEANKIQLFFMNIGKISCDKI